MEIEVVLVCHMLGTVGQKQVIGRYICSYICLT